MNLRFLWLVLFFGLLALVSCVDPPVEGAGGLQQNEPTIELYKMPPGVLTLAVIFGAFMLSLAAPIYCFAVKLYFWGCWALGTEILFLLYAMWGYMHKYHGWSIPIVPASP